MKLSLVVIDPQIDFCDPDIGSLCVAGALQDMTRLASLVKKSHKKIDEIFVTLDSHTRIHIAHPNFWRNSAGNQPPPFTQITAQQVRDGEWIPARLSLRNRALAYVEALEAAKKFNLVIWPIHCVIGTPGAAVIPVLQDALNYWQDQRLLNVYSVPKGSNPFTEHYSAIKAEVVDPSDPTTDFNTTFLDAVNNSDVVLLAGEASSHCVANTIIDSVNYFGGQSDFVKKLVLLKDATSPVTGFEAQADKMIADMKALGMQISTTKDWM